MANRRKSKNSSHDRLTNNEYSKRGSSRRSKWEEATAHGGGKRKTCFCKHCENPGHTDEQCSRPAHPKNKRNRDRHHGSSSGCRDNQSSNNNHRSEKDRDDRKRSHYHVESDGSKSDFSRSEDSCPWKRKTA